MTNKCILVISLMVSFPMHSCYSCFYFIDRQTIKRIHSCSKLYRTVKMQIKRCNLHNFQYDTNPIIMNLFGMCKHIYVCISTITKVKRTRIFYHLHKSLKSVLLIMSNRHFHIMQQKVDDRLTLVCKAILIFDETHFWQVKTMFTPVFWK